MESSDDSFIWTSASNASEDSDGDAMTENINENNLVDEPESGKSYKKILHKRLFEGQGDDAACGNEPSRKKARKGSVKEKPAPAAGYLELRVKLERVALAAPASDTTHTHVGDDIQTDMLKTKRSKKSKKSRRHSERHEEDKPNEEYGVMDIDVKREILDQASQKGSKKKSKRNRESNVTDTNDNEDMLIEDKFTAEETVVETRHEELAKTRVDIEGTSVNLNKKKLKQKQCNSYSSKEFINEENSSDESTGTANQTIINQNHVEHESNDSGASENPTMETEEESSLNILHSLSDKASQRTKLSDRIRFEDEYDSGIERNENCDNKNKTPLFKHFLRANPHLRPHKSKLNCDSLITKDDDLWVFRCPHEMNISTLIDRDVVLDSRCKLKVNGQSYDGYIEEEKSRIAILSFERNKPVIKNVQLSGTINFRKRIPKAHFMESNVMVNNQTNFLPLPNTKCRHPLFGPDYKKAMKLPASVKARLNNADAAPATSASEKKKKHKKQRVQTEPDLDNEPKRKKRKHKHTDNEEPVPKKIKCIKHDPDSVVAWESEKAIEENLFNF